MKRWQRSGRAKTTSIDRIRVDSQYQRIILATARWGIALLLSSSAVCLWGVFCAFTSGHVSRQGLLLFVSAFGLGALNAVNVSMLFRFDYLFRRLACLLAANVSSVLSFAIGFSLGIRRVKGIDFVDLERIIACVAVERLLVAVSAAVLASLGLQCAQRHRRGQQLPLKGLMMLLAILALAIVFVNTISKFPVVGRFSTQLILVASSAEIVVFAVLIWAPRWIDFLRRVPNLILDRAFAGFDGRKILCVLSILLAGVCRVIVKRCVLEF